jgi:cell division protein FtsQ
VDILVHFGDGKYLERYREYEQHLAEWRAQYPKLASVDLRYERQVVLEMQPGATAAASDAAASGAAAPVTSSAESATVDSVKPEAQKAAATPKAHAAAAKTKSTVATKKLTGKPAASGVAMQGAPQ